MRCAVIGMGGFAADHHYALVSLEEAGECRVVAACDPEPEAHGKLARDARFGERGISRYMDYLQMLDAHQHELDFVTVPTPLPLHAAMHRACVEREIACYLEKPPTLCPRELEEMLQVEESASLQTQVGFSHIVEAPRRKLKDRMLSGEFGAVRQVGFHGYCPRSTAYFRRVPWAGRLSMDDHLILDSCIGNAMAHHIHNILFWADQTETLAWEKVESMEARLYRAHKIENFDTCFARARCQNGVELRVAATHTGTPPSQLREWIRCERAQICYRTDRETSYTIRWDSGFEEHCSASPGDLLQENLKEYIHYLNGESARPLTRLIDSRPFVQFNGLLYAKAKQIRTVSGDFQTLQPNSAGSDWIVIPGMQETMIQFRESGLFPEETGAPWAGAQADAEQTMNDQLIEVIQHLEACQAPALL